MKSVGSLAKQALSENENSNVGQAVEDVIKIGIVKEKLKELEQAGIRKRDAQIAFNEKCKTIAEEAGLIPAVLSAYINALVRDDVERTERKAEQMQLLFDEVKK